MNTNLSNSLLEIELNCLYEFAMVENSTRLLRYTGSLKPGWSASSSVPYIRTFWTLSKSEIFRGNQKMSPKSILWRNQNVIENHECFTETKNALENKSIWHTKRWACRKWCWRRKIVTNQSRSVVYRSHFSFEQTNHFVQMLWIAFDVHKYFSLKPMQFYVETKKYSIKLTSVMVKPEGAIQCVNMYLINIRTSILQFQMQYINAKLLKHLQRSCQSTNLIVQCEYNGSFINGRSIFLPFRSIIHRWWCLFSPNKINKSHWWVFERKCQFIGAKKNLHQQVIEFMKIIAANDTRTQTSLNILKYFSKLRAASDSMTHLSYII